MRLHSKHANKPEPHNSALSLRDDDYWTCSRRPLACLIFLLPLLVLYEVGVHLFAEGHPESLRNGADYWMRTALDASGMIEAHLLPALVLGGLLGWHICCRYSWKVSAETLLGMLAESVLFAFTLVILGQLQNLAFEHNFGSSESPSAALGPSGLVKAISFVGAGVYEEVLFRLWMLPVCYAVFRGLFRSSRWAAASAILVTSVVFSAAHYLGPAAEAFSVMTFSFRAVAGCFFALLFLLRGFGITVGCHATYDLLVGIIFSGASN